MLKGHSKKERDTKLKRKNQKKLLKELYANAPKIRCRYCELKDTCKFRARKEKIENEGVITRCLRAPTKNKKKPVDEKQGFASITLRTNKNKGEQK